VKPRLENDVYGAKLGLDWGFEVAPDWRTQVGGYVMPGYQHARLEALQEGTHLAANLVSVTATTSGFAYQAGGGLGFERVLGNDISVGGWGDVGFMGSIPILSHVTSSGQALGLERGYGRELTIIIRATFNRRVDVPAVLVDSGRQARMNWIS
jgi:hypothetical protein